jgi:hypothetical protein
MSPPRGSAIIDAKPEPERREGVEGIELVSINGKRVRGTRQVIAPGPNTIRTQFRWPQGMVQEADLRFHATPGIVYFINYDVFPPRRETTDGVAGKLVNSVSSSGSPYAALGAAIVAPPAVVIGVGERVAHGVAQHGKPATHIDLMVVAHHSSQGVVRQVRAYPDGRVDEKPWAAWAQMRAP